uniref:Uncharacterized protein n=1 Tax=Sinocyclocheilus anshuiensis TaxID=1608454 RepID=A0A671R5K2_9TELE
ISLLTVLAVRCCLTLLDAAPLQKQPLTRATSLAKKILSDISAAQQACVSADLRQLSSSTEELSLLLADITDLSAQVLPSDSLTSLTQLNSPTTGESGFNMGCAVLAQVQQLAQIPSTVSQTAAFPALSPRLSGDQVQVAIHLSLQQLRSFTQDVLRSLRHIAASN